MLAVGPFEITSSSLDRYAEKWQDARFNVILPSGDVRELTFSDYMNGIFVDNDWETSDLEGKSPSITKNLKRIRMSGKNVGWFAMDGTIKIREPKKAGLGKKASVLFDGYSYEFDGIDGLTHGLENPKNEAEAKFVLSVCGASMEKTAEILELARKHERVWVSGLELPMEKQAEVYPVPDLSKYNFVKLASMFDDMTTIDAVLSLNFLNPTNIKKFTSVIPSLSKTKEELLRQRIISRLGNNDVPEDATTQAIEALEKVIEGLEKTRSRI